MRAKPWRLRIAQRLCRPLPPILAQRVRNAIYPAEQALRDNYEFLERGQTGSWLKGVTADDHGYVFSVHGFYDWRNLALAKALCAPGDTIVEVGANIGTETLGFADIVGGQGKVYAFEPLPSNVRDLARSLCLNEARNVEVIEKAASDTCGSVRFRLPEHCHQSGMGHLVQSATPAGEMLEVPCATLDSMSAKLGRARMIFVDVEGAEVLVLRGARGYIAAHRPALVVEAVAHQLDRLGFGLADLQAELHALSYRAFRVPQGRLGLEPVDLSRPAKQCNWLCVHESRLEDLHAAERSLLLCGLMPCLPGLNPLRARS